MASIIFQFHGEPKELLELAAGWARDLGLFVALERFFPEYQCAFARGGNFDAALESLGHVDRVVFGLGPLTPPETASDVVAANPDCLVLKVGKCSDEGLRESALGANTDDRASIDAWKKLVRAARNGMNKGAELISWNTGVRVPRPDHRFTEGALALFRSGVPMLAFAGKNTYALDDAV